jgi:hypothetical protein
MPVIDYGTQFIGVSAAVPIPENKSAQNNSFQEVYTIEDISSYVLPVPVPDVIIQDFFVFSGGSYKLLFKRTGGKVNGYPLWGANDDDTSYFISVNDAQDTWELYDKSSSIASIEDVQGPVPPFGDWDFDGDLYPVTIFYVSGSIQEVIEQLALLTFADAGAGADTGTRIPAGGGKTAYTDPK